MIRVAREWQEKRRNQELIFVASDLRSIDPGLFFRIEFRALWRPSRGTQRHYNPEAVVRNFVRDRAQKFCKGESLKDFQSVEDKINSCLGIEKDLAQGGVRHIWGRGRMDVPPDSLASALELEKSRLKRLEHEKEQEDQFRLIANFRREVLEDPGMALAYSFMNDPRSLNSQTLEDIETLINRLTFHGANQSWSLIAKILLEFINDLSHEEKRDSLEVLMIIFKRYERHDMVERLRSDLGW